jgi:aminoglycoside N3'-acetyltransferase
MAKTYTLNDIEQALTSAGLSKGDLVFVTTSLGMLGLAQGVNTQEELNSLHLQGLKRVLGPEGTILVPTYSYTFGASSASELAIFDLDQTAAKIGPFPEFFRKQPGVIRSKDPMMSVAGLGPRSLELFKELPATSYGADSLFARLAKTEAKCCSIGLGPNWTPFIHHADWFSKVPFRYDKLFHGIIKDANQTISCPWVYAVPLLSKEAEANGHVIGAMAVESKIWRYAELGRARVYCCSYLDYFNFTLNAQRKQPWITAIGPADDPVKLEQKRLLQIKSNIDLSKLNLSELALISRADCSYEVERAIELVAQQIPVTLHSYKSGENHFDWILPESWRLRDANLTDQDGTAIFSSNDHPHRIYNHSLNVEKQISRSTLEKHLHIGNSDLIPYQSVVTNRDWGFCCNSKEHQRILAYPEDASFKLSIQTDFSFTEIKVAEFSVSGSSNLQILIVCYLNGAADPGALSSAQTMVNLAQLTLLNSKNATLKHNIRLLWLPSPAGFAAWADTNRVKLNQTSLAIELAAFNTLYKLSAKNLDLFLKSAHDCAAASSFLDQLRSLFSTTEHTTQLEKSDSSYLLTAGLNPLAQESLSQLPLTVLSIGSKDLSSNAAQKQTTASMQIDPKKLAEGLLQLFI